MIEFKKLLFPITLILLGLTALLVGGRFLYLFFYISLLLFLVPFNCLSIGLSRLRGTIETNPEYGEVSNVITVYYKIDNTSSLKFPYLELVNVIGSSFSMADDDELVPLEAKGYCSL